MNTARKILVYFLLAVTIGLISYTLFIYNFTLSDGVRSGVLSKFSNKGVIFKTWEGELNERFGATRFFPFSVEDGEEKLIEEIAAVSLLRDFTEGDILIDFGDYIKKCHSLLKERLKF